MAIGVTERKGDSLLGCHHGMSISKHVYICKNSTFQYFSVSKLYFNQKDLKHEFDIGSILEFNNS